MSTDAQIWARLADGTPLVTASSRGEGWIVLFHVTANSDWSNLPLSGLFVEMLRRAVNMGPSKVDVTSGDQPLTAAEPSKAASQTTAPTSALPPIQTLDGYGQLTPPPARAAPLSADQIDTAQPSPEHPPGYYGPSGAARAFNIITGKTVLKPLKPIDGAAEVSGYVMRKPMPLEPWLYLAVLALFALDVLIVVLMSSGWSFSRRAPQAAAILLAIGLLTLPHAPADARRRRRRSKALRLPPTATRISRSRPRSRRTSLM